MGRTWHSSPHRSQTLPGRVCSGPAWDTAVGNKDKNKFKANSLVLLNFTVKNCDRNLHEYMITHKQSFNNPVYLMRHQEVFITNSSFSKVVTDSRLDLAKTLS